MFANNDYFKLNIRPAFNLVEFDYVLSGNLIPNLNLEIHLTYYTPGVQGATVTLLVNNEVIQSNLAVTPRCQFWETICYDGEVLVPPFVTLLSGMNVLDVVYTGVNLTFNQSLTIDTCLGLPCYDCAKSTNCGWCGNTSSWGACGAVSSNTSSMCNVSQWYIHRCPASPPSPSQDNGNTKLILIIVLPVSFGLIFLAFVGYYIYKKHFYTGEEYSQSSV